MKSSLTFGEFRLDPVSGHLYRDNAVVALAPKAFALLQCLAANAGRLVSKQELLAEVWAGVFIGDAVLKSTIRELRKALKDDSHEPRFIETAHRRGYRFIAPVTVVDAPTATVATSHKVSYARSGSVNIAYQVLGSGPIDLVFVMGWVSHLEYFWNEPSFARFLTRLSGMARLILFDKRGTGLSDPVPVSELPSLDTRLDDVRAVMDAVGSRRAVLMGVSEGGPLCSLFAATYPEKTEALVMIGSYARRMVDVDYPWGKTPDDRERFCNTIIDEWGGPVGLAERAPSMADDPAFREWWAAYLRMGASPGAAVALTRMNAEIDIRELLPSIRVPTLVIHRTGDQTLKVEEGRYLASRIPGARFVELPGADHLPFVGDQDAILSAVEDFLAHPHHRDAQTSFVATALTLRSNAPPADRDLLLRIFDRELHYFRGRPIASPEHYVAVFDGPSRAVHCALSVLRIAQQSRIDARAGVHIGEFDGRHGETELVSAASEIASAAGDHEVLVSRSVSDLLAGAGFAAAERGRVAIAGERPVPVLSVTPPS
ncbi:MAG TPA: alpha/beta fold hydrolase [Vicinamibacterales bacterium]|nr:alpha/beta fold hydrolase [Vicinamibacterales bacterium]